MSTRPGIPSGISENSSSQPSGVGAAIRRPGPKNEESSDDHTPEPDGGSLMEESPARREIERRRRAIKRRKLQSKILEDQRLRSAAVGAGIAGGVGLLGGAFVGGVPVGVGAGISGAVVGGISAFAIEHFGVLEES